MRLISLKVRNFMGLREHTFEPRGANAAIYGTNGVGKSTISHALHWLLTGKDSLQRADFSIKPTHPDGTLRREGDPEIEAVLDLEPGELTLGKVYREVWSTPRGSAVKVLSTHTTDHTIDGVPVKQAEFQDRVKSICDERLLRLLTDVSAFMGDKVLADGKVSAWVNRRNVLLDICGGVTDEEVFAAVPELAVLPEILGKRKPEDHKAVLKSRRKAVEDKKSTIPVRIDEAARALPESTGDAAALGRETARLRTLRADKAAEQVRIQDGGEVAERTKRLREIEGEQLQIQQRVRAGVDTAINEDRAELAGINQQIDAKRREIRNLQGEIQSGDQETARHQMRLTELRAKWAEINGKTFLHREADICSACGQALPADLVQAAQDKAMAEFNASKSKALEENVAEGKRVRGRIDELAQAAEQHQAAIAAAETALADLEKQAEQIQGRIDFQRSEAPDVSADAEYQHKAIEKAAVEQEIASLRDGNTEALSKVAAEIQALDAQIAAVEGDLGRIEQREKGLARIEELKGEEKGFAVELEQIQRELYLIDRFELARADLLEERVNGYFQTVKWRLSERLMNGGIEPCCVALVDGVPYGAGLNTAGEINAGLEIIEILGRHYGVTAPVFVDRSESVVELRPIGAQVISLVVSAKDLVLRVESRARAPVAARKAG